MKKNNLQKKLWESGLIEEGNSQKINDFKKAFKANYAKEYNEEFDKRTKRKTLIFTTLEFEYLQNLAKKHNLNLSQFLKGSIFAYNNLTFIFPDPEKLTSIEEILREINRRISQSVQYVHLSSEVKMADIQEIKMTVSELEKSVSNVLKTPPRLEDWLKTQIDKDEMFLPKLLQAISYYITT
jgi:hypothetical protein